MRKVQVVLQDDINGGEPAQTVNFALDGTAYEIDLTEQNAAVLREALAPWIAAARRTSATRNTRTRARAQGSADTADIRAWARANGIPVSERGRIATDLRRQYDAAH